MEIYLRSYFISSGVNELMTMEFLYVKERCAQTNHIQSTLHFCCRISFAMMNNVIPQRSSSTGLIRIIPLASELVPQQTNSNLCLRGIANNA